VAGVGSTLPARSVATTVKVWSPGARSEYSIGVLHSASGSASSLHSKVEPASAANVKAAIVAPVWALGPERIRVSGGVVSGGALIVQV
jgi:hypothetical protein